MLVAFVTIERKVPCRANDSLVLLKQDMRAGLGAEETLCQAKVDQEKHSGFFALANEYVFRFNVTMDEVF